MDKSPFEIRDWSKPSSSVARGDGAVKVVTRLPVVAKAFVDEFAKRMSTYRRIILGGALAMRGDTVNVAGLGQVRIKHHFSCIRPVPELTLLSSALGTDAARVAADRVVRLIKREAAMQDDEDSTPVIVMATLPEPLPGVGMFSIPHTTLDANVRVLYTYSYEDAVPIIDLGLLFGIGFAE
jgi:hypothetical protein